MNNETQQILESFLSHLIAISPLFIFIVTYFILWFIAMWIYDSILYQINNQFINKDSEHKPKVNLRKNKSE